MLKNNPENKKEILSKWVHSPKIEKYVWASEKSKKEYESLLVLTSILDEDLAKEIEALWMEYERKSSPEGAFVHQIDRIENLIQAIDYNGKGETVVLEPWWEQLNSLLDDRDLIRFVSKIKPKKP